MSNAMDCDPRVQRLQEIVRQLVQEQRADLLLKGVGAQALELMNIEVARATLSPLVVTRDYRFLLPDYKREVELMPIHKSLYLLFLAHPDGIEFKRLPDYREELLHLYELTATRMDRKMIAESVERLCNPLDNAVNEKCSRIKAAFMAVMNKYQAQYYIISPHTVKHMEGSTRIWFERKKTIMLPRAIVHYECEL